MIFFYWNAGTQGALLKDAYVVRVCVCDMYMPAHMWVGVPVCAYDGLRRVSGVVFDFFLSLYCLDILQDLPPILELDVFA